MGHSIHNEHERETVTNIVMIPSSRNHAEHPPSVHRVGVPPKLDLMKEFKHTVKETLFADDPLRNFRDQPRSKKLLLGIQAVFPILEWGRQYTYKKFIGDLIAGLTIASLAIPQDIGYSKLAHLPPQYGLYSSFVPPLIYSILGSSRDIAIGPVAVISLLLGSLLQEEIDPVLNPLEYYRLAFTATFFAGVTQAALGICRLGFLVDFLSHAAIVGFMAGAAVTIALQQLKGFLGIKKFTTKTDIVSVMRSVWQPVHHGWNWQSLVIGVVFLSFLLATKHMAKRKKRFFWVAAISPMLSVIVSTFFVYITRADKHGLPIVGTITKGINESSVKKIYFSGSFVGKGFKIGLIAAFVALTEAIAIGRTFAAMKDYSIDGNKEMVALGIMNVVGSMTSCYVATGSFSRSSVNYTSGCQTAVSNIVMSVVVMLTLLLITPLFHYTPNAILAAIIISAVLGLIDFEAAWLIWKIDKLDFVACLGAFLGVLFISVEIGLLIAVAISFAKILLHVTRPHTALLGNIPSTSIYRNIEQYPDAIKTPGIVITRIDSAIYFSNSNYVRERVLRWLSDEEERAQQMDRLPIQFLIIEMSPVIDIDTSGIHAMEDLYKSLQKREVQLILANPGYRVVHKLHESKFNELIGDDKIFLSVAEAVQTCSSKLKLDV
ncbi:sulfate transporter 1.2-like [Nymphaea colorata]|nr:sulfate transporter 1.2-like [Nymphaea colorata]XP_031498919.1 sulfate transporter 1.2-like [Nymphaea colorata]XP_049936282.1 sulfate transporter 1.2-like [Nymphaea colorata]XP_049936283.1 sulfate transporter 1.2-like [Nymphaea colorata]XP_049936284.1 sulfate transporter 1.2-like [Nymphaea colorata]